MFVVGMMALHEEKAEQPNIKWWLPDIVYLMQVADECHFPIRPPSQAHVEIAADSPGWDNAEVH